jgi:hypothetical protein
MKFASTKELLRGIEWLQGKRGWSKGETLSYFKVSASTLCRWRIGLTGPSIDTYKRVINKLEQNNFYKTPEDKTPEQPSVAMQTPEQKIVRPAFKKKKKTKKKRFNPSQSMSEIETQSPS